MMNRRRFLKTMGAAGASILAPASFNLLSPYRSAHATIDYSSVNVNVPAMKVMPQVINIFLYGGPSELAGNLSNIADIELHSQNSYEAVFPRITMPWDMTDGVGNPGLITPDGFWSGAGGEDMQFMLDSNYMSVYRTLMKRIDDSRSHRESILASQKGSLDIDVSAGVGTRIAATLFQNRSQYEGSALLADGTAIANIENLLMPFVSFEGDTRFFQQDPDFSIPLVLQGITLDQSFDNPYRRDVPDNSAALDALVEKVMTAARRERYRGVVDAFEIRAYLEQKMLGLEPGMGVVVDATTDTTGATLPMVTDDFDYLALDPLAVGPVPLTYPDNQFTDRIRAAVTLALRNPSSLYVTVGGGLGGWDDHNNATTDYPNRMADLFETLKSAMLHIKYFNENTLNGVPRTTNRNIVINMFGDFGRQVNLNAPQGGWDHGNNQNLFTFGIDAGGAGSPRPVDALGKVVGRTRRSGESGTNDQVLVPASGSYEAEPMSVASTVYSYFGVQNPEVLTADEEFNPDGVPAIDETVGGELPLFP